MHFITSCGTDIGKSFFTCLLSAQLRLKQQRVMSFKPIISGFDEADIHQSDSAQLLASCNIPITLPTITKISPYRYRDPISPHLAARNEHRAIVWQELTAWLQQLPTLYPDTHLLIEGAGGVLAPITFEHTMRDLICALNIPAILVTGSYLGSISHTLTAYEALRQRGVHVSAIIISESITSPTSLEEVAETLRHFTDKAQKIMIVPRLTLDGTLTNTQYWDRLAAQTPDITSSIDKTP